MAGCEDYAPFFVGGLIDEGGKIKLQVTVLLLRPSTKGHLNMKLQKVLAKSTTLYKKGGHNRPLFLF